MCRDPRQGHGRALASGFGLILETNIVEVKKYSNLLALNVP